MNKINDADVERTKSGKIKLKYSEAELEHHNKEKKIRNSTKILKNLKDSGKQDDKVLRQKVIKKLAIKELEVHKLFTDKKEQTLAKELVTKYLTEFTPNTISDKNNLKSVIYLEVLQFRLQSVMNDLTAQGNTAIPLNLVDSIHKNLKEIANNKERLGLIGKDKDEQTIDGFNIINNLKKKFAIWRENNQGSRSLVCPSCGKMVLLKIRMDKWIPQQHPFFKDRLLANKHLMDLYLKEKITRDDIALILDSSPDYIDWLIETLWLTDPEYRKEFRKIENKRTKELEILLKEQEDKTAKDEEDNLESGETSEGDKNE